MQGIFFGFIQNPHEMLPLKQRTFLSIPISAVPVGGIVIGADRICESDFSQAVLQLLSSPADKLLLCLIERKTD